MATITRLTTSLPEVMSNYDDNIVQAKSHISPIPRLHKKNKTEKKHVVLVEGDGESVYKCVFQDVEASNPKFGNYFERCFERFVDARKKEKFRREDSFPNEGRFSANVDCFGCRAQAGWYS